MAKRHSKRRSSKRRGSKRTRAAYLRELRSRRVIRTLREAVKKLRAANVAVSRRLRAKKRGSKRRGSRR